MRPSFPRVVLTSVVALTAACSGGGDGDDGSALGTTSSLAPPVAPALPAESAPGTGVVVIGEISSSFAVTACELEDSEDAEVASDLLRVSGSGTRGNGVPFTIEVVRSAVEEGEDETFTDLITYTDTAKILQVQRFELDGEVSDLRDPDARSTLLRVRPGGLSATGISGPPGTSAPEGPGLVGLALDLTC